MENNLDVPWWAVKTWTSRGFVDGWTCWVNKEKEIVLCVWTGNYNWTQMKWAWSKTAGYLWNLATNIIE